MEPINIKCDNKLADYFWNKDKKLSVHKWHHYFKIYNHHFKRFIGKNPTILEIGIYKGGSLEMWNDYFDGKCQIYGIDNNKNCLNVPNVLEVDNINVTLGDQSNRDFWKEYLKDKPKFDIVIEDGGHTMTQQIVTYEELIDHVSDNGVYLCEDLHTSYWGEWGGKLKDPNTFIEYSKSFVDMLNYYHIQSHKSSKKLNEKDEEIYKKFRRRIQSVHYYDSVIVLELDKDDEIPVATVRK